jgi:hypothetical protein
MYLSFSLREHRYKETWRCFLLKMTHTNSRYLTLQYIRLLIHELINTR